jgi:hypothetical protein
MFERGVLLCCARVCMHSLVCAATACATLCVIGHMRQQRPNQQAARTAAAAAAAAAGSKPASSSGGSSGSSCRCFCDRQQACVWWCCCPAAYVRHSLPAKARCCVSVVCVCCVFSVRLMLRLLGSNFLWGLVVLLVIVVVVAFHERPPPTPPGSTHAPPHILFRAWPCFEVGKKMGGVYPVNSCALCGGFV